VQAVPWQALEQRRELRGAQTDHAFGRGLPPEKWSSLRYGFGQTEDARMPRKRHTPEEIVAKLRQVDVLTGQGRPVAEAVRAIGVTEVTY